MIYGGVVCCDGEDVRWHKLPIRSKPPQAPRYGYLVSASPILRTGMVAISIPTSTEKSCNYYTTSQHPQPHMTN